MLNRPWALTRRLLRRELICFCLLLPLVTACSSFQALSGPGGDSDRASVERGVEGAENGQIYSPQTERLDEHHLPRPQLVVTPEVNRHIERFATRDRAFIQSSLPNYGRYHKQIEAIFREQGVPADLVNLAIVESRFRPQARSHRGAVGLWQLMSRTARAFGLRTRGRDERKDPVRSSVAAAKYLRQLYGILGDWYLALAAYNGGIGRLTKAMTDTGMFDFWELARAGKLSRETADFVPRFIAVSLIMNNPEKYGFEVARSTTDQGESRIG